MKHIDWSKVLGGGAFVAIGAAAAWTGVAEVESAGVWVQGLNVRIAGVMLTVVGCFLVWWGLRNKRPNQAPEPTPGSVTPRAPQSDSK